MAGLALAATGLLCNPALAGDAGSAPTLKPTWTVKVGAGEAYVSHLATTDDTVFAASDDGAITAYDVRSGKVRWRVPAKGAGPGAVVGLATQGLGEAANVIVAYETAAELSAFEAHKGTPIWRSLLRNTPKNMNICENHRAVVSVVVEDGQYAAFAHEPLDGTPLWRTAVSGQLVGAGSDHVFIGVPSGTGALHGRIEAVNCATGQRTTLPAGGRPFADFLGAAGGRAAIRYFEMGAKNERICLIDLNGDGEPSCFEPKVGDQGDPITGALLHPDRFILAANHMYAHNLDPRPDGWLKSLKLPGLEAQWHSTPLRASGSPVWGGEQIVSGFGSTGASDFVHFTRTDDGTLIGSLPVKKAPEIIKLAGNSGVASIYGGTLVGFALPLPGPAAPIRVGVKARPETLKVAVPASRPDLGWRVVGSWSVHPEQAKTSGSMGVGNAAPAVFLDADGTHLVVGGNDDKVRVVDGANGKVIWTSKSLGKDVEAIHTCSGNRFVARIYGGKAFTFEPAGKGFKQSKTLKGKMGWASGLTDDCAHYLTDDFSPAFHLVTTAKDAFAGTFSSQVTFDRRGSRLRNNLLVVGAPNKLLVLDLSDLREGPGEVGSVETPIAAHGGKLTQAWMASPKLLVREYCSAVNCTVELVDFPSGKLRQASRFDTQAAGWSPTVPSALDVDPSGSTIFFFRRDLPPLLLDVASGQSQFLNAIVGSPPALLTQGVFSADGKRLVLAMYPQTWQITVLSR